MSNSINPNSLNHINQKVFIEKSQNNLYNEQKLSHEILKKDKPISTQKKITIPKICLKNKNLNMLKDKKRFNSVGKIDNNNEFYKYFAKKASFLFCPKNQELINYFDKKNKNFINNLSLNNKTKKLIPPKKLAKIKYYKLNRDKKRESTNETITTAPRVKREIYKSSSLPDYLKNKGSYKENFSENKINLSSKVFSDIENPELLINIKKFIENRKKEKNYLHILINNSNNEDFNIYKLINSKPRKYSPRKSRLILRNKLFQEKKVGNETLELISNECKRIKSLLEPKLNKKEEKFKIKILRKNLSQDKLDKELNKFIYKSKNDSNIIVDNQIELLKRKINSNNFTNSKNIELSNSFRSQLFLSISNPFEQLFNTRLYGKLMNDGDFLKELHKNEQMNFKE